MTQASDFRVVTRTTEQRDGTDLPGPWRHAARPGDEKTLCGAPVADMHRFEHVGYHELDPLLRCRDCSLAFDSLVGGR